MNEEKIQNLEKKRLIDIRDFMLYTGLGHNNAVKLGEEIGCRIKIGRRILYDTRKADQYFDSLTGVK